MKRGVPKWKFFRDLYRKGGEDMNPTEQTVNPEAVDIVDKCREKVDSILVELRAAREKLNPGQPGGRELSEAITNFETGSMWMIRHNFSDKPYTPTLRLQPKTE